MSNLFSGYNLSGLPLANRIVMAPMTRSRAINTVADQHTRLYYQQRAGAGLIITEGSQISRQGVGYLYTPGIHDDDQVEGWQPVTQAVHEAGGAIFIQLWHVGRVSHASLHKDGSSPVSSTSKTASDTTSFAYNSHGQPERLQASQPRALRTEEIGGIVQDFVKAAANAIRAGFDGVEIHGANGYLLEQFINGGLNDRSDRYGGAAIENRIRFALEVVDAVCAEIGNQRTGIRISPFSRIFDMHAFDGEEQTWLELGAQLAQRQLAYVHISNRDALLATEQGRAFLEKFRSIYPGTLILAGLYNKAEAEQDIRSGLADLTAFGRPFIANPDLVERLQNDWPLTTPNPDTFYGGDQQGYTDYPPYRAR